jgi:glycosyltransferase involved in cell wall biosynthesis
LQNALHRFAEWLYIALEAIAALFSDIAFFLNPGDLELAGKFVRPRTQVVNGGIDLKRFRFDELGRRQIRQKLGVADDRIVVGAVGRRNLAKGVTAFEGLARELDDQATFVWVGSAEPTKSESVKGDDSVVTFIEFTDDIVAWMSAFDLYVLPSFREGHSQSAMEAAALGLPSVVSEIRGNSGLGTSGVEVMRYPLGKSDELRKVITDLITDAEKRRGLGIAARKRAIEEYDALAKSGRYLDAYRATAKRKGITLSVK